MANFRSWDEVRATIAKADGLGSEPAKRFMSLAGWSYWTTNTGRAIVDKIERDGGLKVFGPLPQSRDDRIRVYMANGKIDKIVDAVMSPNLQRDNDLREAARGNSDVIGQIRALVCRD